jgi:hypothetical protein
MLSALFLALSLALPAHATDAYDTGKPLPAATPPKAVIPAATNAEAPQDMEAPHEEIGFDPKVKRDPYGNIIPEEETKTVVPTAPKLRTDRNLRGDSQILKRNK